MRTFGIERERFIMNVKGKIVPAIGKLLPYVHRIANERKLSENLFSSELFAGQIEDRTPPCRSLKTVRAALLANEKVLLAAANNLGLIFSHSEYIKEEMVVAFEVNPFNKRQQQIWASIPNNRRIAASVVAAVHIHISATEEEVVQILNLCRKNVIDSLISIGDHSSLKRISAYRTMAKTDGVPPVFKNFSGIMKYITSKGGEKNVWDLVRYKPSTKTVEFRMFGATHCVEEIIGYVKACQDVSGI